MVIFNKIKSEWGVFRQTLSEFSNDNGPKLSASLSYYTIFSIAPMLFIVISLAGIFYGREAVQGRLFGQIRSLIGDNAAAQIQEMIAHTQLYNDTRIGAVIGIVVLVIGATGVFTEIQDSINYIWSIKAKPKRGLVKLLMNRLISFSLIISFGFIMLVSLIINAIADLLQDRLQRYFDSLTVYIFQGVN